MLGFYISKILSSVILRESNFDIQQICVNLDVKKSENLIFVRVLRSLYLTIA